MKENMADDHGVNFSDDEEDSDNGYPVPEMQGSLSKWTNYIHGWQSRFIVFKEGTLSYYKSEQEAGFGCRGSIGLNKATVKPHEFDECRFDVSVNDCVWYLRADNPDAKQQWVSALECYKAESGYGSENNLKRHGSAISLTSNTLSTASTSSFKKGRGLKEKLAEMETFRDILCRQIETLQGYFDACAVADTSSKNNKIHDPGTGNASFPGISNSDANVNGILNHGAHALDFKGEALTFKATTAGVLATLQHCLEVVGQREDMWRRRLEKEAERRRKVEELYRESRREVLCVRLPPHGSPDYEYPGAHVPTPLLVFPSPLLSLIWWLKSPMRVQKLLTRRLKSTGKMFHDEDQCDKPTVRGTEDRLSRTEMSNSNPLSPWSAEAKDPCLNLPIFVTNEEAFLHADMLKEVNPTLEMLLYSMAVPEHSAATDKISSIADKEPVDPTDHTSVKEISSKLPPPSDIPEYNFKQHAPSFDALPTKEGPHSALPDEEFYDAVETGLDKLDEDDELRDRRKSKLSTGKPPTSASHHRLWSEIERVTMEQLHYARLPVGEGGWQLFAEDGEMKMYKREEEINGMVVDPLKACHIVKGVTGHEMCHYFFSPDVRSEWETTLEQMTVVETISEDTLVFLQVHKRIWPASQRDALFWSHMRQVPDSKDADGHDIWIVCNHSTECQEFPANTGKCVRVYLTIGLVCHTCIDPPKDGAQITRDDITCKITYCSVVNPGGWAPASVLRAVYKREYPKFLKRFTGYVIDQCKDKPILF